MDTSKLKKFAQFARRALITQVSAKLESVIAENSAARREHPDAMRKLEAAIVRDGKEQVVERAAYTWFNRFSALRFMDVNELNPVRVVSPAAGQFQPEILAEAKAGHMDEGRVPERIREQVRSLLDGRTPSADAQTEAFRLLIVAICNDLHKAMPFLFERIDDYTELLLPDDLLSNASILAYVREAMTLEVCEDVEVIGWLYQFYISEKKDEVFAGLKKNKKITAENIPAATQLFTPHWIVRYLVENSLGRLWLLNRPNSKLAAQMDYYIAPEEPETDFLRISRPEDIRICDPACGSGHMLTYAFDLLYAIYEEEGYEATEIPGLILAHNLHGIEIDDRAGALAAFALAMKAATKLGRRRFLRHAVRPNICIMQDVQFTPTEMQDVAALVGIDLFTAEFQETLGQFEKAKHFGSLIVPELHDPKETLRLVAMQEFDGDLLLRELQERTLIVLRMAEALSAKFHVVVANPPYMGGGGMNSELKNWAASNYPASKSDLFAMFIDRCIALGADKAMVAMVTMQNWMFISSFEKIRRKILTKTSIKGLLQIGFNSFPELNSKYALAAAFCLQVGGSRSNGDYLNLNDAPHAADKNKVFFEKLTNDEVFRVASERFLSIPGAPVQYSFTNKIYDLFETGEFVRNFASTASGLQTNDNDRFIRFWHEVAISKIGFDATSRSEAINSNLKWVPHVKGGPLRKWWGNLDYVVNWENDGAEIFQLASDLYGSPTRTVKNLGRYFASGATWTDISAGQFGVRKIPVGCIFDTSAPSLFAENEDFFIALLNSKPAEAIINALCPSLHYLTNDIASLPLPVSVKKSLEYNASKISRDAQSLSKSDWNWFETSWDFTKLALLTSEHHMGDLKNSYNDLRTRWRNMTEQMQRLEMQNNRNFIDAYCLQDELNEQVPLGEITLTCNPVYRYGIKLTEAQSEARLLQDTVSELLHYAVGCMFGRYSLDEPGLILANQGEGLADYLARVPEPTFEPDADNVIPVLDGDWFADDIAERFRKFLRVTFGEAKFQENLAFIESALGKDIRKWFSRDFYDYHVRRYKKRPIYWMFASPKGSFQALIYMHRYRPDTVSVVLNDYLREYRNKLEAHRKAQEVQSINHEATPAQRTKALKDVGEATKVIEELDGYERDVLYPLATQKIEIDLDDGVKANYPKFGAALKPIKGLSDADD